jgi:hypothetical protein
MNSRGKIFEAYWEAEFVRGKYLRARVSTARTASAVIAVWVLLVLGSGRLLQRTSKQKDDTCSVVDEEGKFQVTRVFDLAVKLTKLVCRCVNSASSETREQNLNARARHVRMANVQQLSSDDETVMFPIRFQMEVNLIRVGPIEHLP